MSAERSSDIEIDSDPVSTTTTLDILTSREIDMLCRISTGMSNQEIAEDLFLSPNSVKTYIRSAYRKIGVATRTHAVIWCLHHGLGETPRHRPGDPSHDRDTD